MRSVLLEVPLGTYTGWNPIARGFFKGHIQSLGGGYIPFAKTKAQRLASGDPRLSLEERYGTHDALRRAREGGREAPGGGGLPAAGRRRPHRGAGGEERRAAMTGGPTLPGV